MHDRRRLIGLASQRHFPPTPQARDNLLREGISPEHVAMVGNTVVDAVLYARAKVRMGYKPIDPEVASLPSDRKLVLATITTAAVYRLHLPA